MARLVGLTVLFLLPSCAIVQLPMGPGPVKEVTLMGEGRDKVLLVDVSGLLSFRKPRTFPGFPEGESLPARLREDLDRAREDSRIRALLVRIDSPGGTVTASDVLFHEIRSFADEREVPVVAVVVEDALSGGYYVALAADEIVAHPTAIVGSVGVFVPKLDVSELLDRWGVRSELTKSGAQKDLLSPLRPLSPEERETLQTIVHALHERFEEAVRTRRPGATTEDLQVIATSAPFTAARALELHMVDRLGYIEDAFQSAVALAGVPEARLVVYRRGRAEPANVYSSADLPVGLGTRPLFLAPQWVDWLGPSGVYY